MNCGEYNKNRPTSVHQGSGLLPLVLILLKDTATRDNQRPAPYTLLYANDVFLASNIKADPEQFVQKWDERFVQHDRSSNLDKTEFWSTDRPETGTITVNGYQPIVNCFAY